MVCQAVEAHSPLNYCQHTSAEHVFRDHLAALSQVRSCLFNCFAALLLLPICLGEQGIHARTASSRSCLQVCDVNYSWCQNFVGSLPYPQILNETKI